MSDNTVGGEGSSPRYFALYLLGVAVGSAVRFGAWVLPTSTARWLEDRLLPGR